MSDMLQRLAEEIRRKEDEAARLQAELAELNTALRVVQRMEGDGNRQADVAAQHSDDVDAEDTAATGPVRVDQDGFVFDGPTPRVEQDLSGATILDACRKILREHGAGGLPTLHYREIAREAKERGYQGRSDKAMEQSFWAILNRHPGTFKAMGQGRFTLAEQFGKTEQD